MRTRFPSMAGLRAFEAAARHLSFTRAAVELNLTQTAISHQIKNLEDALGARLFTRNGNSLGLTEAAEAYLRRVRAAILEISAATDSLAAHDDEQVLTVECLGTFAIKRLLPRLHAFRAKYPSILLRLRTIQFFEPKKDRDFDVAIWHGAGRWDGLVADSLGPEDVFPVCSPILLARGVPLAEPADLRRHTIIRTVSLVLRDEWPAWLDAAGLRGFAFADEMSCDFLVTSVQAAVEGLGIVLGRSGVVDGDLAQGRLVEPFAVRARSSFGYFLVAPTGKAGKRKVELFRSWLLDEMAGGSAADCAYLPARDGPSGTVVGCGVMSATNG